MSHNVIIIDEEIARLIEEAGDNAELVGKLDTLKEKAHAVDAKLNRTSPPIPPFIKAAMHELLENLQEWLTGASAEAENFEAELDEWIASLDQYLP